MIKYHLLQQIIRDKKRVNGDGETIVRLTVEECMKAIDSAYPGTMVLSRGDIEDIIRSHFFTS